ncbi:transposase [Thiocapsa bogorovii]|uniref:transposase n=1 Tax=Thiocapsa bogorovii TaxID=521689 RepID=UPI001E283438|nr:transposase [Thiocapsa bogorovii]UHD18426.1 transposase [Thiocapsa bogorovii]
MTLTAFDEFHLIQLANQAVDAVRRAEVKATPALKRSRYIWLKDQQDWSRRQLRQYLDLRRLNLKTHRAYRIKESLREIFRLADSREEAEALLTRWYSWARRCRLEPMNLKRAVSARRGAFSARGRVHIPAVRRLRRRR